MPKYIKESPEEIIINIKIEMKKLVDILRNIESFEWFKALF